MGATVWGEVTRVRKLGMGLRHPTSELEIRFGVLELPGARFHDLNARLKQVDTAREKVDAAGVVRGIHPAFAVSSPLAAYAWRLLWLEPPVALPVWATKFAFARSPDPEIAFPAGTELTLALREPPLPAADLDSGLPPPLVPEDAASLPPLAETHAQLTSGRKVDRVNMIFRGTPDQLERAFDAAGWAGAQRRSPMTILRSYRSLIERRPYSAAPMSTLLLEGRTPDLAFQKNLNTFARRHHLRLWRDPSSPDTWVAAAVEDTGIRFAPRKLRWVHTTDAGTSAEQAKILHDLAFTGCVARAGEVEDQITVIVLRDCPDARLAQNPAAALRRPGWKSAVHSLGADVFRSNFVFVGAQTMRLLGALKSTQR